MLLCHAFFNVLLIVLKKFKDLVEGVDREIGSTFSVDDERADLLALYNLVKVGEVSEKQSKTEAEKTNVAKTTTVKKTPAKRPAKKTTAKKTTTAKKAVEPKAATPTASTQPADNSPANTPEKE